MSASGFPDTSPNVDEFFDPSSIAVVDLLSLHKYIFALENAWDIDYNRHGAIFRELMGWEFPPTDLIKAQQEVQLKYDLAYKTGKEQFNSNTSGEGAQTFSGRHYNPSTIVHGLTTTTSELKDLWVALAPHVAHLTVVQARTLFQVLYTGLNNFSDKTEKMGPIEDGVSELDLSASIAPAVSIVVVAESSLVRAAYEKGVPLVTHCGKITMTNNDTTVTVFHDHVEGLTEQFERGLTLGGAQVQYRGSIRASLATDIFLASANYNNSTWTSTSGFVGSVFARQFLKGFIAKLLDWFKMYGKPAPGQATTFKLRPHVADRMCECPHLDDLTPALIKLIEDRRDKMDVPVFEPKADEDQNDLLTRFGKQYGNVASAAYAAQLTAARTFRGPNQPLSHGMAGTMSAAPEEYDVVLTYERIYRICIKGKLGANQFARVRGKNSADIQAYLKSKNVPLFVQDSATTAQGMVLNPPDVRVLIDEGMTGVFKDRIAWIASLTNAAYKGDVAFRCRHNELNADVDVFLTTCFSGGWLPIVHKIGRLHNQEVLVRLTRRDDYAKEWDSTATRLKVSLAMITTVSAAINQLMSRTHSQGVRFNVPKVFQAMVGGMTAVGGFGQYLEPIEIVAPKAAGPGILVELSKMPSGAISTKID